MRKLSPIAPVVAALALAACDIQSDKISGEVSRIVNQDSQYESFDGIAATLEGLSLSERMRILAKHYSSLHRDVEKKHIEMSGPYAEQLSDLARKVYACANVRLECAKNHAPIIPDQFSELSMDDCPEVIVRLREEYAEFIATDMALSILQESYEIQRRDLQASFEEERTDLLKEVRASAQVVAKYVASDLVKFFGDDNISVSVGKSGIEVTIDPNSDPYYSFTFYPRGEFEGRLTHKELGANPSIQKWSDFEEFISVVKGDNGEI